MSDKIHLEHLPRKKYGSKTRIDWKNSVGCIVEFEYKGIVGEIEVLDSLPKGMLRLKYKNDEFEFRADSLIKCQLGTIIGKITREFKVNVGAVFKDECRHIEVIDRDYHITNGKNGKNFRKKYKYRCLICGWSEGVIEEHHLINGVGCSCCSGTTTVPGINDVYTTDNWMVKYFANIDDSKKYSRCSSVKVEVRCPLCNCMNLKKKKVQSIYEEKSVGCICGDGYSYPEKFVWKMFKDLNIDVITQLNKTTFEWCGKYKYDFYIPSLNTIIETHGIQHYEEIIGFTKRTLKEEQANDIAKKQLALNNIDTYIVIDSRKSELEWMKDNILKSKISKMIDLSSVNWNKCEEFALGSLLVDACKLKKENPTMTILEISNILGVSKRVAWEYLKKGRYIGI